MSDAEFVDFVTHRSPALLRTAYLLCGGDHAAAEDLLQEVLERVFPRWRRIRAHPEPYVRAASPTRRPTVGATARAGSANCR